MTTHFYEQIFLVNNIPEIAGILEVRDMIKSYAYSDEYYMNKAKEFAERFKIINETIRNAYSRRNPISQYVNYNEETTDYGIAQQEWDFGFDSVNNSGVEFLQIHSSNCYLCGEYLQGYSLHVGNIQYCNCQHNNELPDLDFFEDENFPILENNVNNFDDFIWGEQMDYFMNQLFNDYNEYNNDEYYYINGYENTIIVPLQNNYI